MDIWESDRVYLQKEGYDITRRKIRKVAFIHDGELLLAEVGKPSPYDGNIVRVIYEDGQRGCFLICGVTVTMAPKDSLVEEL